MDPRLGVLVVWLRRVWVLEDCLFWGDYGFLSFWGFFGNAVPDLGFRARLAKLLPVKTEVCRFYAEVEISGPIASLVVDHNGTNFLGLFRL